MNRKIKHHRIKTRLVVLSLLLPCSLVRAEPAANEQQVQPAVEENLPKVVSIGQLLQILHEKSPRFAVSKTQIEDAEAEVTAADVLPNPTLSYGRFQQTDGKTGTQFDGQSQQQYTLSIPMLLAGQHGARKAYAERKVEVAQTDVEVEFTKIARETWRLFVQLLAQQQKVQLLENAYQDIEQLKTIVAGRADAGTASQYDVLRMAQEALAMSARLDNARTDVISTSGEIGVLLGFPHWQPQVTGTLAPLGMVADVNQLWQQAEQNNPEIGTAYRETVAADANIERAKTERWPVPALQLGTAYTDKPYGLATYVGVAVDVPIFDRGQGGMARATANKHTAALNQELLLASKHQELERAVEVLNRRRETLTKFEQQVLAPLPTIQKMAENAYRYGKASVLELLDVERSRVDMKSNYIELLVGEIEAELDTMMVSGGLGYLDKSVGQLP